MAFVEGCLSHTHLISSKFQCETNPLPKKKKKKKKWRLWTCCCALEIEEGEENVIKLIVNIQYTSNLGLIIIIKLWRGCTITTHTTLIFFTFFFSCLKAYEAKCDTHSLPSLAWLKRTDDEAPQFSGLSFWLGLRRKILVKKAAGLILNHILITWLHNLIFMNSYPMPFIVSLCVSNFVAWKTDKRGSSSSSWVVLNYGLPFLCLSLGPPLLETIHWLPLKWRSHENELPSHEKWFAIHWLPLSFSQDLSLVENSAQRLRLWARFICQVREGCGINLIN